MVTNNQDNKFVLLSSTTNAKCVGPALSALAKTLMIDTYVVAEKVEFDGTIRSVCWETRHTSATSDAKELIALKLS